MFPLFLFITLYIYYIFSQTYSQYVTSIISITLLLQIIREALFAFGCLPIYIEFISLSWFFSLRFGEFPGALSLLVCATRLRTDFLESNRRMLLLCKKDKRNTS